jgi:hypothetical protein
MADDADGRSLGLGPATITINVADLDALIEKRLAEREAKANAPRRGPTPGCNCRAEGYTDRGLHQLGCTWADPKGTLAAAKVQEMFDK